MSMWQGACHILIYELRKTRWGFLGSFFLALYLAIIGGALFQLDEPLVVAAEYWPIDFVFLTTLPCLGFVLSHTNMLSWRQDTFSGKLAEWRILPISLPQLIWGRLLQIVVILLPMQIVFFLSQYFWVNGMKETISPGSYILFGLFWFLYSLGMAATYAIWEYGYSGKTYMLVCIVYSVFYLLLTFLLSVNDISIVQSLLSAMENGEWWYLLIGLLISIVGIAVSYMSLKRRLETRSF
ncbi:hypothetical protein [Paenibacillus sp. KS-LC4]|uniref:hypothetical protein n=1 Tax=Paenibacillus sp. KS-LC4 TaxID=2979727 RepID=UPI0030D3DC52